MQSKHPFPARKLDLRARRVCRELVLECLSAEAVTSYIGLELPAHALPGEFIRLIHQKTEGHALFLVDLLSDLRRRRAIVQDGDR